MSDSTKPVALINIVGLTADMLDERMPRLRDFAKSSCSVRPLNPVLPALTCSVQSSMLTGRLPAEHGIVGNGWYERDQAEIRFWKQSNHLVGGEKLWDAARDRAPGLTVANCFWWYAMHAETDITITPRPISIRWTQDPGHLHRPSRPEASTPVETWTLPAVQLLGTNGQHRVEQVDRRCRLDRPRRACPIF